MTAVSWKIVEGGEIGSTVALSVEAVVNKFFSLGVKNIQDECNNVSNKYRIFWSLKPPTNLMTEYDLSVTYGDGRRELQPAFELFEPITIHGKILDCYYPSNLLTAATIQHSIGNSMNPLLTIYAKALQVKDEDREQVKSSSSSPSDSSGNEDDKESNEPDYDDKKSNKIDEEKQEQETDEITINQVF